MDDSKGEKADLWAYLEIFATKDMGTMLIIGTVIAIVLAYLFLSRRSPEKRQVGGVRTDQPLSEPKPELSKEEAEIAHITAVCREVRFAALAELRAKQAAERDSHLY